MEEKNIKPAVTRKMEDVYLHLYDLKPENWKKIEKFIGLETEKIYGWHTSLCLYGREFEYGPDGLKCLSEIDENKMVGKIYLGATHVEPDKLFSYLLLLSKTKFQAHKYNVFKFNCNSFTDFLANELLGHGIPKYILEAPVTAIYCIALSAGQIALNIHNCTGFKKKISNFVRDNWKNL